MRRGIVAARALIVTILAGCLLGCSRLGSLDLPLMLACGERILADGAIPRANVFSWVDPAYPYLNDKWAFMVLVASVERLAGTVGLAALKVAFGGGLAALLQRLARRELAPAGAGAAAGVACVAVAMLSYRLNLRADWLSYVGVAATLLLLPAVLTGRLRAVSAQILMMPVWAACHGYWVLGPLLVLAAAAGARSRSGALTGIGCVAAAAISPFGVRNVIHPFEVLGQLGGPLAGAVTELRAPFSGGAPVAIFHVLAIALTLVAVAGVVADARRRRWDRALVVVVLVVVSWRLDRNLALLGLTVPAAAAALPRLRTALAWGGLTALVVVVGTAAGIPRIAGDRVFGVGDLPERFPVALTRSLPAAWAQEHYVNDLSLGSFLVRERGSAFIDGNTEGYAPEFLARYRGVLSGELSAAALERDLHPSGWMLRTSAPHTRVLVLTMFLSGDHAPALWDDVATLFRSDLEPEDADVRWRTWLRDVYLPRARPWFVPAVEAERRARAGSAPGARRDDVAVLRAALELAPWDAEFYRRLGALYAARGDEQSAARCRVSAYRIDSP